MTAKRFHIYVIGMILVNFYGAAGYAQLTEQTKFTGENKMVTVEQAPIISTKADGNYSLLPYRDRRGDWGTTIGVSYSTYEPKNYEPNFVQSGFDDVYSFSEMPLIELNVAFKRNARGFSYGGEVSVGIYNNDSNNLSLVDGSLQLIPVKIGGIVLLDALAPTPLFVPYLSAGGWIMMYQEDNNSSTFKGNTQVAPYINAGVAISLDWIDKDAARTSYEESGLEATYAFFEARSMFEGQAAKDPDFSSAINFAGGLKVEF